VESRLIYLAAPYSDPNPAVVDDRIKRVCVVDSLLMSRGLFTVTPLLKHFILGYSKLPNDWAY
jgi:hypothetical protein